jgi:hypothetical protein
VAQCWYYHKYKPIKNKFMKTSTHTRVILKGIDLELKALLQQDLERFKMIRENKQAVVKKAA